MINGHLGEKVVESNRRSTSHDCHHTPHCPQPTVAHTAAHVYIRKMAGEGLSLRQGDEEMRKVHTIKDGGRWWGMRKKTVLVGVGLAVAVVAVIVVIIAIAEERKDSKDDVGGGGASAAGRDIAGEVTQSSLETFLDGLMKVAEQNPNAQGVPCRSVLYGYNDSAAYLMSALGDGGFEEDAVSTIPVLAPVYVQKADPVLELEVNGAPFPLIHKKDFARVRYSGGDGVVSLVSKDLVFVAGSGCNTTAGYPDAADSVVVVSASGECDYATRVTAAEAAGAVGVLLVAPAGSTSLPGGRVRASPWYRGSWLPSVPVVGISGTVREIMEANAGTAKVSITTDSEIVLAETFDVCAEVGPAAGVEPSGKTIMMGAHLDSVAEGPGMNDDGSGTAGVLEVALAYRRSREAFGSAHKARFCWWAAEELGLIGSYQYVKYMQEEDPVEWDAVALYANFDMLASPNYALYIHQANDSIAQGAVLEASMEIQNVFISAMESMGKPWAFSSMRAGSDFLPFLLGGVPTGGLLTGAGGIKSAEERTVFGGFANAPYDPCYHQPCDTLENIAWDALVVNTKAAAMWLSYFVQRDL